MNNFDKNFIFIKSKNIIESYKLTAKIISENSSKNFVVFSQNIKKYDNIFSNMLEKYNIKYNRDYEISIIGSQISNLIFSCLNLLISGLTQESIFNFLSFYENPKIFSENEILEFKNYCRIYNINDFNIEFKIILQKKFMINNENLDSIEKTRTKILSFFDDLKKNVNNLGFFRYILNIIQDKSYKKFKNYNIFLNILNLLNLENNYINNFIEIKKKLIHKFQNVKIFTNNINNVNLVSSVEDYSLSRSESIFLVIKNYDEFMKYKKIIEKFDKKYIIFLEDKNLNFNIIKSNNFSKNKLKTNNNNQDNIKFNPIFFSNYINLNISQIENYYKCSIYFLFSDILKIENKKEFSFDAVEYGALVHYVFEQCFKNFYNFKNKLDIRKIIKEYMIKKFCSIYSKYKLDHMINKISENLIFISDIILKINEKDDFIPEEFEVKINRKIKLEKNFFINLNGKIDRIDVNKKTKEFRIIDYKTGKKIFDFNNVLYGTDLQAIIYLNSYNIEKHEKSGAFYFSTKKPLIDSDNKYDIEKKIADSFFYQGISTENSDDNKHIFELTKTQMNIVLQYSDFMIKKAVKNILNGEVYKHPKNFSGNNFYCETCDYKNMCINFNIEFVKPKKYKKIDEIVNIMSEKLENENK